jgi:hypothetical protein
MHWEGEELTWFLTENLRARHNFGKVYLGKKKKVKLSL